MAAANDACPLQLCDAINTASLAAGLHGRIVRPFIVKKLHRFTEFRRVNLVPVHPLRFQKAVQLQLGRCLQTQRNRPADNFNFPKAVSADNVLQPMRHFRKRAPLAVF